MMARRNAKPIDEQLRDAIARAEKAGMTRYRLARETGLAESHIKKIATGETIPQLNTAEKIAAVVGVKITIDTL